VHVYVYNCAHVCVCTRVGWPTPNIGFPYTVYTLYMSIYTPSSVCTVRGEMDSLRLDHRGVILQLLKS